MRLAEKWDGQIPGATAARRATGSAIARRAEAEAEAARAARRARSSCSTRPASAQFQRAIDEIASRASAGASPLPLRRREPLAPDARLRAGGASRPAPGGSPPWRPPTAPRATPARWRRRDSRSASANALESSSRRSTASCRAARCCERRRAVHALTVRLGEMEDAVGLEPRQQRVAVPRLEQLGDRRGPWRVGAARRRRGRRTPARSPAAGRRARRRSPRPRSARRCRGPPSRAAAAR